MMSVRALRAYEHAGAGQIGKGGGEGQPCWAGDLGGGHIGQGGRGQKKAPTARHVRQWG